MGYDLRFPICTMKPNTCQLAFIGHKDMWHFLTPTVVENLRTTLFGLIVEEGAKQGLREDEHIFSKCEVGIMKVFTPPNKRRAYWPRLESHEQWAYAVVGGAAQTATPNVRYVGGNDYTLHCLLRNNDELRRQAYESEVERVRGQVETTSEADPTVPRPFLHISSWDRRETIPLSMLEGMAQRRCRGTPQKPRTEWAGPDPQLLELRVVLDNETGAFLGYYDNDTISTIPEGISGKICTPPEEKVELSKAEYEKLKKEGIL